MGEASQVGMPLTIHIKNTLRCLFKILFVWTKENMFKKINTIFQVISINQYRQKMFILIKVSRKFNSSVLLVLVILHISWLLTQLWTCFILCIPFQSVLVLFLTFVLKAFSALTTLYLPGSSLKKKRKKKAALRPSNQFFVGSPEVKVQNLEWPGILLTFFRCRTCSLQQASCRHGSSPDKALHALIHHVV